MKRIELGENSYAEYNEVIETGVAIDTLKRIQEGDKYGALQQLAIALTKKIVFEGVETAGFDEQSFRKLPAVMGMKILSEVDTAFGNIVAKDDKKK